MVEDPRRAIVDVMARLGKETQLHLDERQRHFQVTDAVTMGVSFLLVVLAIFNVYYVSVLYSDLDVIVSTMDSMYANLQDVDREMTDIAISVEAFDRHMVHMESITREMGGLTRAMPSVRGNMDLINGDMWGIHEDMGLLHNAMGYIDQRIHFMKNSLPVMRENMRIMAKPMGMMDMLP